MLLSNSEKTPVPTKKALVPPRESLDEGPWTTQKSADLYGTEYWGADYFHINEAGNLEVTPNGTNAFRHNAEGKPVSRVDLHQLVQDLLERGVRAPMLVRFSDIVRSRVNLLFGCFSRSIKEYGYKGNYCGVYPIKVNQQYPLVDEIIRYGKPYGLGLECGSKPELLIGLALMDTPDGLIICNGFKDYDYIETAILSQKIGRNTIIVLDRMSELDLVIAASRRLNTPPRIGLRAKLDTQGQGRWFESSGARSKFGLTPSEIVICVNRLKEENMLQCLELLHFHVGSQIPSIQDIKAAVREGTRFYTELYALGVRPKYMDVGGGLGVDYDGSGHGDSSTNYTEQEYCNDVVSIIQSLCDEKNVPHPNIVSESGRSLVAHSSILIFDVLGVNEVERVALRHAYSDKDSRLVQDLHFIYENVSEKNINEFYNDLVEKKRDTLQLFSYGVLSLEQRAKAEDLYWATVTKMGKIAKTSEDAEDIRANLEKELSDTYFCNFSVFQSLPDSWAVNQRFPVMPIHRLETRPERRATLVDLTCDSDGKLDKFINMTGGESQDYIEVHSFTPGKPYFLGVFLTGAYQEILGDLHNLFGDTDAVHITLTEEGYTVDHLVKGESVTDVLNHVQYLRPQLWERIRQTTESAIIKGSLSRAESRLILEHYERGLSGYTYLNEQGTHL